MSSSGKSAGTIAGDLTVAGKSGFAGAAPIARTGAYALAGPASSRNLAAPTSAAISATAATSVAPVGYTTAAQANAIPTAVNQLVTDVANMQAVLRQVVVDLESYGLVG